MSDGSQQDVGDLNQVLAAISNVGSGLGIDHSEQEMAEHLLTLLSDVLPGVFVAVRTFQTGCGKLVACATSGQATVEDRLETVNAEPFVPLFDEASTGFAVPVLTSGQLAGLINLEGVGPLPAHTRTAAEAFAALFAVSIRDRRLSRDAKFLRKWLANTIDNANALIFVVDARRRVTLVNRALARLLGQSPEDALNGDVLSWVAESQHAEFQRRIEQALEGRRINGLELALRGKEGETVSTIFNMARTADVVDSVVAIGQDVSPVKVLENQVMQAEKLASLGQLVAGVVHEINNPLTSITVYADFMIKKFRTSECDAEDLMMLEKILEGSNRILKFTRDLVDYGKPTGSEADVVSFNEIVQQSISFCEHVLDGVGAELKLDLAANLPPLYGIKDQLQQVIINLLTNACHALEDGGQVTVRTRCQSSTTVSVEIGDSGCGIADGDLPNIFNPFFTTKTPGEGTGLGLSIVKKIVDFHNGTIMVESEAGRGTTFSIVLPTGHDDDTQG